MELRNTKIPVKFSPAQLQFGRNTRTLIPTVRSSLRPMGYNTKKVLEELQNLEDTQKYFYDRNSKPLKPLEIGDTVRLRNPGQSIKTSGKVVRPAETPKSYFVSHGNTTLRRNRRDLIKTKKRNTEQQEDAEESTESENCSFPNNLPNDSSAHSGKLDVPSSFTTSSGRVIKPPSRLVTEC